jgi:hypothetical protein
MCNCFTNGINKRKPIKNIFYNLKTNNMFEKLELSNIFKLKKDDDTKQIGNILIQDIIDIKLMENLTVISNIHKNEKLYLNNDILTIDNSYLYSVSRWWYEQNGLVISNYIKHMINIAITYKNSPEIIILLNKCKEYGLLNLKQTYIHNIQIIELLTESIDII